MFKFSDTDTKAMMKDIKEHDDSLNQTLLASVPGLVNPSSGESAQQALATALSTSDDRYSSVGRHRQLIPSNAFNISTLFQPTSAFLTRVSDIIPPGYENETDHFGGVLEDFVVRVFLPQLEEKVTASFQQAVGGESDSYCSAHVQVWMRSPPTLKWRRRSDHPCNQQRKSLHSCKAYVQCCSLLLSIARTTVA